MTKRLLYYMASIFRAAYKHWINYMYKHICNWSNAYMKWIIFICYGFSIWIGIYVEMEASSWLQDLREKWILPKFLVSCMNSRSFWMKIMLYRFLLDFRSSESPVVGFYHEQDLQNMCRSGFYPNLWLILWILFCLHKKMLNMWFL